MSVDDIRAWSMEDGHGVGLKVVEGLVGELVGEAPAEIPQSLRNGRWDELDDHEEACREDGPHPRVCRMAQAPTQARSHARMHA